MRRREFIALFGSAATWPLVAKPSFGPKDWTVLIHLAEMTANGTKRTCQWRPGMSAFGGKAEKDGVRSSYDSEPTVSPVGQQLSSIPICGIPGKRS
jgi:hypothetical protein